jgi:signal transduction histidine kinase
MRRLPRSHSLHSGPGAWEHRSIASERVDHQAVVKLSLPAQPHNGAALHQAPIPVLTQVSVGVAPRAMQWSLGVAVVPMVAGTVWLALTSEHLQRPVASALYFAYLTAAPMLIGLYWWACRPESRSGPLLVALGVLAWIMSWQFSDWPLPFNIGVLVEGLFFWLTFYLFLAFPMGRLEPTAARWLMAALALGVVGFFLPWALLSPVIAGGGPLTRCAPNCPENVLQLGSAPGLVEVAGKAETYTALTITVGVVVVYVMRLAAASRPRRRALTAVAVTSLLFLPAYFAFNFSAWILRVDQATLDTLAWIIVGTRILLPLGFLIALLQAHRFAARALQRMLECLATRPTPEQWRETIAAALDDVTLRLGYYDPETKAFLESDGSPLTPRPPGAGETWVPVHRDGREVAAMVIDETLAEDPELVRAAASATLLAVENGDLEGELHASRARILEAGNSERRRIERDLHDSTQQRLVSLRIHLTLAGEQLDGSEERAMLERLGADVDVAIEELRAVAHGIYPPVLGDRGVGAAIKGVAQTSAMPIRVTDEWRSRRSEAVETTVYFCCLECLQNAAKHAGREAVATVRLFEDDGHAGFSVEDDGAGFNPGAVERGTGLTNLADRVAAVGGTLTIDSARERGTRVTARIPV